MKELLDHRVLPYDRQPRFYHRGSLAGRIGQRMAPQLGSKRRPTSSDSCVYMDVSSYTRTLPLLMEEARCVCKFVKGGNPFITNYTEFL